MLLRAELPFKEPLRCKNVEALPSIDSVDVVRTGPDANGDFHGRLRSNVGDLPELVPGI